MSITAAAPMRASVVRLERRRAGRARVRGHRVKFTPSTEVLVSSLLRLEEDGCVIGLLETEMPGEGSSLRPGSYYVRLECVRGQKWVARALDDEGRVAATAASVAFYPYRGRRRNAVVEPTGLAHTCVALPTELVDFAWAMTIRVSW